MKQTRETETERQGETARDRGSPPETEPARQAERELTLGVGWGKISQKNCESRGWLGEGMAALNPARPDGNSEEQRRAPREGLVRAAAGLSARAVSRLLAATISAFRRGTRWVTCSLADRRRC